MAAYKLSCSSWTRDPPSPIITVPSHLCQSVSVIMASTPTTSETSCPTTHSSGSRAIIYRFYLIRSLVGRAHLKAGKYIGNSINNIDLLNIRDNSSTVPCVGLLDSTVGSFLAESVFPTSQIFIMLSDHSNQTHPPRITVTRQQRQKLATKQI